MTDQLREALQEMVACAKACSADHLGRGSRWYDAIGAAEVALAQPAQEPKRFDSFAKTQPSVTRENYELCQVMFEAGRVFGREETLHLRHEFAPDIRRWYSTDRVRSADELKAVLRAAIDALHLLRQPITGERQRAGALESSVQAIYGLDTTMSSIEEYQRGDDARREP